MFNSFENIKRVIRKNFRAKIYLNTGSSGLVPSQFYEGINIYRDLLKPDGPGAYPTTGKKLKDFLNDLRNKISEMIVCDSHEICFAMNTTDGINKALNSIPWEKGDQILIPQCEYISLMLNCMRLVKQKQVEIISVPTDERGDFQIKDMIEGMGKKVKLVVFSHVNYQNGKINPVNEICREARKRGILTLVDGAQSVGQIPVNLQEMDCDFYPFPAHKWLCSEEGAGVLYISGKTLGKLSPVDLGYLSVSEFQPPNDFTYIDGAKRFECASLPYMSLACLSQSVEFFMNVGITKIREDILEKTGKVIKELNQMSGLKLISPENPENGTGLISVVTKDSQGLIDFLEKEYGIISRPIPDPFCARFSFHFYNTEIEVETFLSGVKKFLENSEK